MKKTALLGILFLGCGVAFGQAGFTKQEKAAEPVVKTLQTAQPSTLGLTDLNKDAVKTALAVGSSAETASGSAMAKRPRAKAPVAAPYRCGFDDQETFEAEWRVVDVDGDGRKWKWYDHNNWDTYNGETNSGFVMSLFRSEGDEPKNQEDFLITDAPVSLAAGKAYVGFHYGSKLADFRDSLRVYYGSGSEADVSKLEYIGQIVNDKEGWHHVIMTFEIPTAGDYYFHLVNCSRAGQFGIWLDNVEIGNGTYVGRAPDVSLSRVVLPLASCGLGREESVSLQLTNTGLAVINKMRLTYQVDGGTPVVQEISEPLAISASKYYAFDKRVDMSAEKEYTITAKVEMLESGCGEPEVRVTDNEGEGWTAHFSRADLPLELDFAQAAELRQMGYNTAYWDTTTEAGRKCLSGLMADAPAITRCVSLDGDVSYRIGLTYKAGGMWMSMAIMPTYFDVLYGEAGTPVNTWKVAKAYLQDNGGYTNDEFVTDEIVFTPEMSGDYSIAIVPRPTEIGYFGMFYVAGITVSSLADHDIRLASVQPSIARYTPAQHAVRPSFDVMVVNRGMRNENGVYVTVKNGEDEVAVSGETAVKAGDTALYTMAGAMERPEVNSEVTLTFEAAMPVPDELPNDNKREWKFKATDELYAYDDIELTAYPDAIGVYGVPIGNVFTLAEKDTLTGITIGWYDLSTVVASPFKVGLEIYAVNAAGVVGDCYLSVDFSRDLHSAQTLEIPARVLPAGRYYIALRQLTNQHMALGYDGNKEGCCYLMMNSRLYKATGYGYVAVRALFGHAETVPAKDVEVLGITAPRERGVFAANEPVEAVCINNGHEPMEVTFKCTVNGQEKTQNKTVAGYALVKVRWEYDLSAVGEYDITVEATAEGDENADNDKQAVRVSCVKADPYVMDFELCEDFSIELGPWKSVDRDKDSTCGITGLSWPNVGVPQGFMAFNPVEVPMTTIVPHDGDRLGACFASLKVTNNDWLISPLLRMPGVGAAVSFYVRAFQSSYQERYNVLVSAGSDAPADFVKIGATHTAGKDWEEVVVDLADYNGKEVYVAIQCVSRQAFIFLIDDIVVNKPLPNEGVEDMANYVKAYPNPVTEQWTVTAYGLEINRVEIFNTTGTLVFRSGNALATDVYRVNMSGFTPGLYTARVHTNAGVQTLKVVVR